MDQWSRVQDDDNPWDVQQDRFDFWDDVQMDNYPWNSLGVCQQDADRHRQAEDR